jgi:type I restriction enzyme S subunit
MNKYSTYKSSKIDWLGDIPSHWVLSKNRFFFKKKINGFNNNESTNVLSLTTDGIKIKEDLTFGKTSSSYIGHQLVKKGDLVFTPRDFDQTPILSDVSKYDGCISNLYIVDEVNKKAINHFVNYYWYGLKYYVDYFKNFSYGMRYSFNRFQFNEIPLLVPPIEEQNRICNFLDHIFKTTNLLIEKNHKKIQFLKEKRISLIQYYVCGHNLNFEMIKSNIEWIGNIPKHWKINRVGRTSYVKGRIGWNGLRSEDFIDKGPYLVTGTDFKKGEINWSNCYHVDQSRYLEDPFIILKDDDVLITKDGSIGKVAHIQKLPGNATLNSGIFVTRPKNNIYLQRYFFWIISSSLFTNFVNFNSSGSTIIHLYQNVFERFFFPIPPIKEQKIISDNLDKKIKIIDEIISKVEKNIKLIEEYNRSITASAVTGKINLT